MSTSDYVMIAITPALLIVMISALAFYLISCFYGGAHDIRLKAIAFLGVMGMVLTCRIAIEEGREYAIVFAAPLAFVLFIACQSLVRLGPLLNLGLVSLIWWTAWKLTWDSTVVDDTVPSSGEGLLETESGDSTDDAASPDDGNAPNDSNDADLGATTGPRADSTESENENDAPFWQQWLHPKRRPHTPGRWIIYYALGSLPLLALGNMNVGVNGRRPAFFALAIYVAATLAVLLSTSFLGIRKYLRQRRLEMPMDMAFVWLGTGGVLIGLVMLTMLILPRPGVEVALDQAWRFGETPIDDASDYGIGSDSAEDDEGRAGKKQSDKGPPSGTKDGNGNKSDPNSPNSKTRASGKGKSGNDGQSSKGQSSKGQSSKGQSSKGQSSKGQSSKGQSSKGQSSKGQSSKGQSSKGQSSKGQSSKGQSSKGQSSKGQSSKGQSSKGQSSKGQSSKGQSSKGQSSKGQSSKGQSSKGQSSKGQSSKGQSSKGQSSKGQSSKGQSSKGQSNEGQSNEGQSNEGQSNEGQSNEGQSNEGQSEDSEDGSRPKNGDQKSARNSAAEQDQMEQDENDQRPRGDSEPQPRERKESKRSDRSRSSEPASKSRSRSILKPLQSLSRATAGLLKVVYWIGIIVLAAYLLIRYWNEIRAALEKFLRDLRELWERLFGRRQALQVADAAAEPAIATAVQVRFRDFTNPFASGAWQEQTAEELVRYSFAASEAWAQEHDLPRKDDQTALEFADSLANFHPELKQPAKALGQMYTHAAFAPKRLPTASVEHLRALWDALARLEATREPPQPVPV